MKNLSDKIKFFFSPAIEQEEEEEKINQYFFLRHTHMDECDEELLMVNEMD